MIRPSFNPSSPLVYFGIIALGVVAAAQLFSVTASSVPLEASRAELWTFFISLWITLATGIAGIWHGLRITIFRRRMRSTGFLISYRQALLLAGVITITGFMNSLELLQAWDIIPLIIAAVLLEFFFQAQKVPHAHLHHDSPEA